MEHRHVHVRSCMYTEWRRFDASFAVATMDSTIEPALSPRISFASVDWTTVPATPGVYVVYDLDEIVYVGMAGRDGQGSLRKRLKDHASGQIVNMFAQYLFLARVQFVDEKRITHPREAKAACRSYLRARCSFRYVTTVNATEARALELRLKRELKPVLNGSADDEEG